MTIDEALYGYLTGLTSVSNTFSTRIYPSVAPDGAAFPRATYSVISSVHEPYILGASGIVKAVLQIDVWDNDNAGAAAGADVMRNALDGFRFLSSKWNGASGVDVRRVVLQNQTASFEEPVDDSEVGVFRRQMDFLIVYHESIPTLS